MILNHEGVEDLAIVHELAKNSPCEVSVIKQGCARYLKGVLKNADFLIGSRFHALISSLTQSVPVIGLGWSHKYQELFADFGIDDFLINVDRNFLKIEELIDALCSSESREIAVDKIRIGVANYKKKSVEMWNDIQKLIKK